MTMTGLPERGSDRDDLDREHLDRDDLGALSESPRAMERISTALLRADWERKTRDPFGWLSVQEVLPPPPPERRPLGIAGLLALMLVVAAVSAYAGMTFVERWPDGFTKLRAEASAVDVLPRASAMPLAAAAPAPAIQSFAPAAPPVAVQLPAPTVGAGDGARSTAVRTASLEVGTPPAQTVQGISDTEIRFGMAAPFAGPAKEMGRQLKLGIDTAFNAANDNGGVNGRQLKLVTADDGYEPARTLDAMKQLYEKDQVFGFIENYGSPTALISIPYALEHNALFFGAFTGAKSLRQDPPDRYVFNYRAGYAEETDAIVRYLIKVRQLRPEEIAVLTQQDAYGDAGMDGVTKAIRTLRGGAAVSTLRMNYNRNTVNVDDAIAQLRRQRTPIKAVVLVATSRPAAKFIEKTRDLYPDMIYATISGVGSSALADELTMLGPRFVDGVIVSQVVPPVDSYASVALAYKTALAKYFPGETPDYMSLESYLTANILIEGLRRAGPQLDTETLVSTLEKLRNFDLGLGPQVSFGPAEHQAVHKVWGTQLDKIGHYHTVELE
jgi:branched-chain amino acid transport system substrate-binding protein